MGLHVSYIHRLFPVGWTLWKLRPAESNHFTCGFRLSEYVSDCTGMADTAFNGNGEGQHKLKIWTEQKGHFKLCNKCHKLTLSVLLHKTPTAVFKQSWRTLLVKGCAVFSSSEGVMDMNWTFPLPLMTSAVTALAEHIQAVAVFPVKHMLPWASGVELAGPDSILPKAFPCSQFYLEGGSYL